MRLLQTVLLFLMIWLEGMAPLGAQTGYRPPNELGEPRFAIEAATFRSDQAGMDLLEVYYKVFYDGVSYQKSVDGYRADYEVAVIVEGPDGVQLEGTTRQGQIKAKTFAETRSAADFVINIIKIPVASQDVTIRAILTDKLANTSTEVRKTLKRRDYWGKFPSLSRVEFAREMAPASGDSKFNRGETRIIPSVTRLFGGDFDTLLRYYQEIYPGDTKDKSYRLIYRIYHRTRGTVHADTVNLGDLSGVQREICTVGVADIHPGDYELDIRLEGRRGRVYDRLIEEFELELTAETIFRNDYEMAVEMLKYLASGDDINKLKKAKTPQYRRQVWDEYWRLREAQSHDREHPNKVEYFRRIRHANRNFSFMKKDGWKTSRGMVYISYGEPDEVDDHPFELATKPYQVWNYYRSNPVRSFYFVDEWGDGDYELQPPGDGVGN